MVPECFPTLGTEVKNGGSMNETTLPIAETFVSIQGEGMLTGLPSWFVRLAGCNLRCRWCDTPYASWDAHGQQQSIPSLLKQAKASRVRHAVLTGGEPMLFEGIEPLCDALAREGWHITIETAGTIARTLHCDLMSISPKLSNSTPAHNDPRDPLGMWHDRHEQRRLNVEVLDALIGQARDYQLKFVVCSADDVCEIESLLTQLRTYDPSRVLLMPEGVEPALATRLDQRAVAQLCIDRGWRYCHRVHIEVFGNQRGT